MNKKVPTFSFVIILLLTILYLCILFACTNRQDDELCKETETLPNTVYIFDSVSPKIGTIRLTIDSKCMMWNHGIDWHNSTLVEYLNKKNNTWEFVTKTEYDRNAPHKYIDVYLFGKQILLANLRSEDRPGHMYYNIREKGTIYLRNSRDHSWSKYELSFRNPQRLVWSLNKDKNGYDHYAVSTTGTSHNEQYWTALQKVMDTEERCWYFNNAYETDYKFIPERKEIDVIHLMKTARVIRLRVVEGKPPLSINISNSEVHFDYMPLSPLEDRTKHPNNEFNLVDPQVQTDLIRNGHPCASYYEEHHLIAPKDNYRKGFLYPSF